MPASDLSELLGPELASALAKKGYASLTQVQEAVLDPALAERDLRISSQTGSGKTLAIGFAVRHVVAPSAKPSDGIARPRAVVVTPTRELAKQVEMELSWLYAPSKVVVTSVTGGSSVRDEFRMLSRGPSVVVGTPGRLLDHLKRGAINLSDAGALVLDEADRMLDLGFREDLLAILGMAPAGHRTHLVSATFPREVEALARQVQTNAIQIQGTPLGTANTDIDHVVHLVKPNERVDALINLLLAAPGDQVLAFARTRADVARICEELDQAGFSVDSLSGEMEQNARHRALSAFKNGKLQILVATDVAARGIDHQDIAQVVQLEPPTDADTYTHRSGRTGRAGRKGMSCIMVQPAGLPRLAAMLKRAGVRYRMEPVPTAEGIAAAQDEKLLLELGGPVAPTGSDAAPADAAPADAAPADAAPASERKLDERALRVAARLIAQGSAERALALLIERTRTAGHCAPRDVTPLSPASANKAGWKPGGPAGSGRPREVSVPWRPGTARPVRPDAIRPTRTDAARPVRSDAIRPARTMEHGHSGWITDGPRPPRATDSMRDTGPTDGWVRFRVSWGQAQGADARRLLPMLCRRGKIRGSDIGAIELAPSFSLVEVATRVATEFERATQRPDPRDPAVVVRRESP